MEILCTANSRLLIYVYLANYTLHLFQIFFSTTYFFFWPSLIMALQWRLWMDSVFKFDFILILQVITSIFMRVILSGINKNYVSMQNCPIFSYQIIMTRSSSGANKCEFNAFKTLYIFFLCWYWNNSPPTLPPIPKKNSIQ